MSTLIHGKERHIDTELGLASHQNFSVSYRTIVVESCQQNLTELDPRLEKYLNPSDYFFVRDLTVDLKEQVRMSGVTDGTVTAQILHTSATLLVNELDEPMLLMDIVQKLRSVVPKHDNYFHNGPMRTVNLCEEDTHCDRNADAHVKTALIGHPSTTLIVRDGELLLGRWQKVALVDFDGPRVREVVVQILGYR